MTLDVGENGNWVGKELKASAPPNLRLWKERHEIALMNCESSDRAEIDSRLTRGNKIKINFIHKQLNGVPAPDLSYLVI